MRVWIGTILIRAGMAMLPADTRKLFQDILLYHVPGALTEAEKAHVRAQKLSADRERAFK